MIYKVKAMKFEVYTCGSQTWAGTSHGLSKEQRLLGHTLCISDLQSPGHWDFTNEDDAEVSGFPLWEPNFCTM